MDDDPPDDRTADVATAARPTDERVARSAAFAPDALAGQVVLVTGASQGIGASVAMAAAAAGADVAIGFHRHIEAAEAVVTRVRDTGATAEVFQADLADRAQARGLVHRTLQAFGRIDGLVNNAGIMPSSPFLETTDAEWDTVIETDLSAVFATCQAALPGMLQQGSGSIVNIASRLAVMGMPGVVHYAAAKAGIIALTRSLAREFGPKGVRINAVAPGVTNTPMGQTVMSGDVGARRRAELPLGRFAEPAEVADAVVFLLSDASSVFIGQTLHPNCGGYMA